jgi:glycosyltransferase involved in cell wall biosynthesis
MMRILFVLHCGRNPKTAVYRGYLVKKKYCEEKGWKAEILTPDDFNLPPSLGRFLPVIYPFQAAFRVLAQKETFRLIVFHSYCGWVFHLLNIFLRTKLKTITALHGLEEMFFREMHHEAERSKTPLSLRFRLFYICILSNLVRFSAGQSTRVLCLNRAEREFMIQKRYQSADKIRVVPNDFPDSFTRQRVYAPRAKRLIFVGQWLPMKGTRYLVEAFEKLLFKDPELRLSLVGTQAASERVLKDFPESVRSHVSVLPSISHGEIFDALAGADIFIFPSLFEASGRAFLEAMASGIPVITTAVGIVPDIVKHNENGLLIAMNNSDAIVEAVMALKDNPPLREKIGRNAQGTVSRFREPIAVEECLKQYVEVCQSNPGETA